MGAHMYVRAPPPYALGPILVLILYLISTVHLVNGSDSETLIEFKDSLVNGENLTTWIDTTRPCNNNKANWEGLLCTNGSIWGIKLEGKKLEGSIDANILARLPSLVSISFNNNSLDGHFPDFRKLQGTREIFLSNNRFYGEIPADAFKGLKWLKKLYLSNNNLIGHIPMSLTTLPKLKELMLQHNHFDGDIPKFEEGKLTRANFANNHLRGRIPEGLQNFPPSQFSGNAQLCGAPLRECERSSTSTTTIVIIALVVAAAVASVIFAVVILSRHHEQQIPVRFPYQGSPFLAASANLSMQEKGGASAHIGNKVDLSMKLTFLRDDIERFNLSDLLKAAAEILGSGMFGSSYKASLSAERIIVVKRFKEMNNVGKEEFCKHMTRLGSLRHPNIQPLLAFYFRKEEKLFVSEFVHNISLGFHLHGNQSKENPSLDWPTRLKIVKGVVKGLEHLYDKLPSLIVPHGHLKSSNVLLNKNYEALLADYGLVPVTNPEHARDLMMAYKSPEYKQLGRISKRTDIWCLGLLILEVMTGKIPGNTLYQGKGNDADLTDFINTMADQELNTVDVFDKEMTGVDKGNEGEMIKLFKIGLSCCETEANKRMDIKQVVEMIEEVKEKDGMEDDFYSTHSSETGKRPSIGHSGDLAS